MNNGSGSENLLLYIESRAKSFSISRFLHFIAFPYKHLEEMQFVELTLATPLVTTFHKYGKEPIICSKSNIIL